MDDLMIEQLLQRAAGATAYPPTPVLRGRVSAAISLPTASRRIARRHPSFALAAIALVAVVVAIALAVPSSRSAIADLFGIEGTKVERLPTPAPGITPTPLPAAEDPASIATPATLAEASRLIGFEPALPRTGGDPSSVYVKTYAEANSVAILRYPAYDLWEARPLTVGFGKGVPDGVVIDQTSVDGHPAYWIEGGPHIVYALGYDGSGDSILLPGSERTVTRDTLIWRTDFALYRMETTLPETDAIGVASTLP